MGLSLPSWISFVSVGCEMPTRMQRPKSARSPPLIKGVAAGRADQIASLKPFATRNATFFDALLALIWISSPVAGLRPLRAGRAGRIRTCRTPRLGMRILLPFFGSSGESGETSALRRRLVPISYSIKLRPIVKNGAPHERSRNTRPRPFCTSTSISASRRSRIQHGRRAWHHSPIAQGLCGETDPALGLHGEDRAMNAGIRGTLDNLQPRAAAQIIRQHGGPGGACIQCPAEASSVCFITTTALSMFALINSANSFGKKSLIQTNRVRFSPSENTCTEALRVTKRPPGSA